VPTRLQITTGFIVVMLIWSTTPVAIKWSVDGPGFLFGVTARMVIGMFLILLIAYMKKVPLPWHRQAILTYSAAGMGIYGAMLAVYWGAQYIPSGFISVIFGLTPIMTGLLAWLVLQERELTVARLIGMLIGVVGLFVIFNRSIRLGDIVALGIIAVCLAVFVHAMSSVLVKRLHVNLSALAVTTGGMLMATPAYLITWWLLDGEIPEHIPSHALWSIVYLGVIATSIGFSLYFYILKYMRASQVAMLTLATPVLALWIGQLFNGEVLSWTAWLGTSLILVGMAIYQWGFIWLSANK
jgi:drug/metabolite transporter (DMT)-like permease